MHDVELVQEFHEAMGLPIGREPHVLTPKSLLKRVMLIQEELNELVKAGAASDLVEFADAWADLMYVVAGTAVEAGLPGEALMLEVHRSNMSKVNGHLDNSGKWIKPKDWSPPNISAIIKTAKLAVRPAVERYQLSLNLEG